MDQGQLINLLRKQIKEKDEQIKVLTLIRENYENRFKVRMFANGDSEELEERA